MPVGIPTTCLYMLGAKSTENVVQQKGQRITYILTRPNMIFFRFLRNKKCVSVVTCKVKRAFSIVGSFIKINKFTFNQVMG